MKRNNVLTAFLAFGMYFLTGAACIIVGSSLTHLAGMYDMELDQVVLLGSAYAFGRVLTVYGTGRMVEKTGAKRVLAAGVIFLMAYLIGLPLAVNFYAGIFFAFLGGIGMGAQDTVCPVLLSAVFKKNYAGSLSVGQAMFGLGSFATPFLIGLLLTWKLPFYGAYFILLIVPVMMLVCIPFVQLEEKSASGEPVERVRPLYARKKMLTWAAILVLCAAYSAVVNSLGLYISSFAESLGISPANAAFMLTIYNVGSVAGSLIFAAILKRMKPQAVLIMNNLCALAAVVFVLLVRNPAALFVGFMTAGFFLGVLFSVIVTVATRIGYERISIASSLVASAGGGSDILTPMITGFLVGKLGIGVSFYYTALMIVISLFAAFIIKINTNEKKED